MLIYLSLIDSQENKDKFEYIYNNYRYTMLYAAREQLGDEYLAEDAVQEAFIAIAKNISYISIKDCNKLRRLVVIITRNKVVDIIRNFDNLYRIPLELSLLYGYSHREISKILGISENLVRTRVFRAKQQLKQIIMKEME